MKLRDKFRMLYFQNRNIYSHQIWQEGELPSDTPTHKVT